jgi:hypothetical protein
MPPRLAMFSIRSGMSEACFAPFLGIKKAAMPAAMAAFLF